MANLFLSWDEARGEQLPHYCVACAAPATEWVDWRLCNSRHLVFSIEHTYVDVTLPVCPEHRSFRSFLFTRVGARRIYEDGIELSRVSPGFVDAVWDYREAQERHAYTAPPPPRRAAYVDYKDDFYEPRHHRRPPRRYARSSSGSSLVRAIGIAIALVFLAPFVLILLAVLLLL